MSRINKKTDKELAFLQDLFIAPDWGERFAELIDEHVKLPDEGRALYAAAGTGGHAMALVERARKKLELLCVDENAECIGPATNNQAEYHALLVGLAACVSHTKGRVRCVMDSELVVNQLIGAARVRNAELRRLRANALQAARIFAEVSYRYRPRTFPHIACADALANQALDDCTGASEG